MSCRVGNLSYVTQHFFKKCIVILCMHWSKSSQIDETISLSTRQSTSRIKVIHRKFLFQIYLCSDKKRLSFTSDVQEVSVLIRDTQGFEVWVFVTSRNFVWHCVSKIKNRQSADATSNNSRKIFERENTSSVYAYSLYGEDITPWIKRTRWRVPL